MLVIFFGLYYFFKRQKKTTCETSAVGRFGMNCVSGPINHFKCVYFCIVVYGKGGIWAHGIFYAVPRVPTGKHCAHCRIASPASSSFKSFMAHLL